MHLLTIRKQGIRNVLGVLLPEEQHREDEEELVPSGHLLAQVLSVKPNSDHWHDTCTVPALQQKHTHLTCMYYSICVLTFYLCNILHFVIRLCAIFILCLLCYYLKTGCRHNNTFHCILYHAFITVYKTNKAYLILSYILKSIAIDKKWNRFNYCNCCIAQPYINMCVCVCVCVYVRVCVEVKQKKSAQPQ